VKTRLLLVDTDTRSRLSLAARLAEHYSVISCGPGEDALKLARQHQPSLALVVLPDGAGDEALRLCRMLKTDLSPVRWVGLRARGGAPQVETLQSLWLVDGYLGAEASDSALLQLLAEMQRGEKPAIGHLEARSGLRARLRRLLNR
jgi:DNA-binding NarL/FixJ family response regulator